MFLIIIIIIIVIIIREVIVISSHNIAAIAAVGDVVLVALGLVRGQVDVAPRGSPVPPAMVQSFYFTRDPLFLQY